MKTFSLVLAMGVLFCHSAEALLPPLYQTANEIKAIVSSRDLGQKLESGEVIQSIIKNENGYEITTNHHRLQVNVIYAQTGKIGPAEFNLQFQDPISNPRPKTLN